VLACVAELYSHYYFALLPFAAGELLMLGKRSVTERIPGVVANAAPAILSLPALALLRGSLLPSRLLTRRTVQRRDHGLCVLQHDRRVRPWSIVARSSLPPVV